MSKVGVGPTQHNGIFLMNRSMFMTTTGELRAIIQELQLVDIGDAASYLGEEASVVAESAVTVQPVPVLVMNANHLASCDRVESAASHGISIRG